MSNPHAIEKARQGKRRALTGLYSVMTFDVPKVTKDADMANLIGGVGKQDVRNLRVELEGVGALKTRRIPQGRAGIASEWSLVMPLEEARAKLDAKWAVDDRITQERVANISVTAAKNKAKKANGAASHTNGATPDHPVLPAVLVASSGPDASRPLQALSAERYDPPRALVEAARQFAGLNREIEGKVKELEAMGVHVDRDKLAKAVSMPADPRLTAVAEALPYIEHLERANTRLTTQNEDYRTKVANIPTVQGDIVRLRNANERLVSENTALRQQLSNRGDTAPARHPLPKDAVPV